MPTMLLAADYNVAAAHKK